MTTPVFIVVAVLSAMLRGEAFDLAAASVKPWITLETTTCYGTCPMFTLRVFDDGRVEYVGKRFVRRTGTRHGRIGRSTLQTLRKDVADAHLSQLPADCCDCRGKTDHPWTFLEITDKEGTWKVRHYHGCETAPEALADLEEHIISTAGAGKWIR